jgi:uncharacterized low-complexity protein
MTKIVLIAGALILASHAAAWAEPKSTTGHGASEYAPGDRMHDKDLKGKGGASQFAPGQNQRTPGGASELSPGDKMNDKR